MSRPPARTRCIAYMCILSVRYVRRGGCKPGQLTERVLDSAEQVQLTDLRFDLRGV